jgi:hypothetical protein
MSSTETYEELCHLDIDWYFFFEPWVLNLDSYFLTIGFEPSFVNLGYGCTADRLLTKFTEYVFDFDTEV